MYIYQSKDNKKFIVLNDDERTELYTLIEKLYSDLQPLSSDQLEELGINHYDINALDWLQKMCWYYQYDNSEALDPTLKQLTTFINPLLMKVYRKTFFEWTGFMKQEDFTLEDMTQFMSLKRRAKLRIEIEKFGDYTPF